MRTKVLAVATLTHIMMIEYACFLYSCCLFVALAPQCSAQWFQSLSPVERYLYAQLEDALVNDAATLEQLREVFIQQPPVRPTKIHFLLNIKADSIPASNCSVCSWGTCAPAFCPVNKTSDSNSTVQRWKLCSPMHFKWSTPHYIDAVDLIHVLANTVVPWCAHGISFTFVGEERYTYYYDPEVQVSMKLSLKKLTCQPFTDELTDSVGEFFSWIQVYTEAGGKPQNWKPQQQATVQLGSDPHDTWGPYWGTVDSLDWYYILKLLRIFGLIGCLLLIFSLSLLIPRLFLRYHNKLVHRETSPGFRSLYWGTAVFSLLLVFTILPSKLCYIYFSFSSHSSRINFALEIFIPTVFLVISIIAARKSGSVPIPAAKFTTHVLFCCCCCFCCSSRCKSKGVQVLALWAFMTIMYYHIMEAFTLVLTLFFSIMLTLSYALMYVSGIFFGIMLVSIILLSCQSTGRPQSMPAKCLGVIDVCAALLSFSFVILVFFAFMMMGSFLIYMKVSGFEAVSLKFSLLPSIALSVAGWLIRKKLLKEDSHAVQPDQPTDYGATGHSLNDGEREGEENQSAEEQQHLLA